VARYPHQEAAARRLGADVVIRGGRSMRSDLARELGVELHETELGPPTSLGGADVTFDCIANGRTLDDAMRFTRARGAVIVVGMPGVPDGIDWTAMWHKELDVRGSYTSDEPTFERAVGLAAGIDAPLAPLVGARFPLEEWPAALRSALHSGASGVMKTAFVPAS
jgi:threonine dehydrogenase-like Zn-dependent dehydrogenase